MVRAGAPRRSQASSLRIKLLRRASIAFDWRARSALAKTKAEYPPSYSSTFPSTTSHVRSVTSSRNQRSCVTTKTAKSRRFFKCAASQATPSTSRWFVGSSRRIKSRSSISNFAKPTRRFSPPEREAKVRSKIWSSKLPNKPVKISRIRGSLAHSCFSRSPITTSPTVE